MPQAYESTQKRTELVRAASRLFYEHGLGRTTFADVASLAAVPLGNVYYYFKTKEALAEAVIVSHENALRELFASWVAAHSDPHERLRCLVRAPLGAAASIVQFGCPHGSLCQELEKLGADAPLAKAGARLLGVYIDWADEQFRAIGKSRREAHALAIDLIASMQGTLLIAHTMRSEAVLKQQLRRVEQWLDESTAKHRQGK